MIRFILWTLGLLLVVVALLPILISTDVGTRGALSVLNTFYSGEIEVEELELHWLGEQRVRGLAVRGKEGAELFSLKEFETDTALLYLLFGGRTFGDTEVIKPELFFPASEKEQLRERLEKKKGKKPLQSETKWPRFKGSLHVIDGKITLAEPLLVVSNIEIEKQEAIYTLEAKTSKGEIKASFSPEDANLSVRDFPLALLNEFEKTTLFTDLLGETGNLTFQMEPTFRLDLSTEHLQASLSGELREGKLVLEAPSTLTYTLTPTLFKKLIPKEKRGNWSLAEKTALTFNLRKAIFPKRWSEWSADNLVLEGEGNLGRAELIHGTLGSYSLSDFAFDVTVIEHLKIAFFGRIQGREATTLAGEVTILGRDHFEFETRITQFPVTLLELISSELASNIDRLLGRQFDLSGSGSLTGRRVAADLTLQSNDLEVAGTLSGKLPTLNFVVHGKRKIAAKQARVLGPLLEFEGEGKLEIESKRVTLPNLSGRVFNSNLDGNVRGRYISSDDFKLKLEGDILDLPLEQTSIREGSFHFEANGAKNRITGEIELISEEGHHLEGELEIEQFIGKEGINFEKADYQFDLDLEKFPTTLISSFLPGELNLSLLVGKSLTLQATGRYHIDQTPRGVIDLKSSGSGFDASLSLSIDDTVKILENEPAFIHWELTPERYRYLLLLARPEHPLIFELVRPTLVTLELIDMTCPPFQKEELIQFLCTAGFETNLSSGPLFFRSKESGESVTLQGLRGSIKGENFSESIELHLGGTIHAPNLPRKETSSFAFDGKVVGLWTQSGTLNREGLSLEGELSLDLVPVKQLTEIVPLDDQTRQILQAMLGSLVNARIYGQINQMSGPLTVDIKSSNFKTILPIQLRPEGIYLRDQVDAELTITPEVNQTFLRDINPLFITGAHSDHPVRLNVQPGGFFIPLKPYSLEGIKMAQATIDFGKITVRNGGQVQQLMNFLKAEKISKEGEMEAWFTPIYMSLDQGVASYERFDALLAGNVHIALWGSINLITDKVKMTLGIATSTLEKRFGLKGLPSKDMLQIKMRGTTKDLDLDWSAASTRIGILIARSATGQLGNIVGSLVEQFISGKPPPPPTTQPFPWSSKQ